MRSWADGDNPLVLKFPEVGGKPRRPKELADDLYADRGYDRSNRAPATASPPAS